jgi:oligopeptide/dipeptide ABC transporter ATP-binding protein
VQAQILNLLHQQQQDRHMAMVLVTHDLGVVAGRTDEIIVMYAGQVVERAPTRALFANVRMPYTEALLKSIPKLEQPSHTRLQIIGGRPPDLIHPPAGCRFAPRCPYAQPKCHAEQPPLIEAETPGHEFRCWFPVGTERGREALERNLADHLPAAEAAAGGDPRAAELVEVPTETAGDI